MGKEWKTLIQGKMAFKDGATADITEGFEINFNKRIIDQIS